MYVNNPYIGPQSLNIGLFGSLGPRVRNMSLKAAPHRRRQMDSCPPRARAYEAPCLSCAVWLSQCELESKLLKEGIGFRLVRGILGV